MQHRTPFQTGFATSEVFWSHYTGLGFLGWLPVGGDSTVPPSGHPGQHGQALGSGAGGRSGPDLCDLTELTGPLHRGEEICLRDHWLVVLELPQIAG